MVDTLRARFARILRVADADVTRVIHDYERDQYEVRLRTGGTVIVTEEQWYAMDDHPDTKSLPKYENAVKRGPVVEVSVDMLKGHEVKEPEGSLFESGSDEPETPFYPDRGTSNDVMVWVDDDAGRAVEALKKERERDKPRVALIKQLERIADGR
jgi:hypothetical protein